MIFCAHVYKSLILNLFKCDDCGDAGCPLKSKSVKEIDTFVGLVIKGGECLRFVRSRVFSVNDLIKVFATPRLSHFFHFISIAPQTH